MKRLFPILSLLLLSGCMNLYTRCPGTDKRIEDTYQSTKEMFLWSWVVAFPQVMAPAGNGGFEWYNILTVPLGAVVFVDDCCEAVGDTLCFPFDATRKASWKED